MQIITNVDTALCYGGTAQASAFTYGGQNPYSTSWDNGSSSITTYLTAGIHYVNVIDFNGCSVSDSVLGCIVFQSSSKLFLKSSVWLLMLA